MKRVRRSTVVPEVVILCTILSTPSARAAFYDWDIGEPIPHMSEGPNFAGEDLSNADLSGADLTGAVFVEATLANANLSGAIVTGANFWRATNGGFTREQLYSTASYQNKDLRGIGLLDNDLTGWDFSGQDLTRAYFGILQHDGADLTGANFSGANLTAAMLSNCVLTDIDLTGAVVTGATLALSHDGDGVPLTKEQLYSTASYQDKNLQGIELWGHDLRGWDFSGQRLVGAAFSRDNDFPWPEFMPADGSYLNGADLSGADLRNAILNARLVDTNLIGANLKNANLYGAMSLPSAVYDSTTIYNQWTLFHDGTFFEAFDPVAEGLTFAPSPAGDLDANDVLDAIDVNLLSARIRGIFPWRISPPDTAFDLNSNGGIDQDDHRVWVQDLKHTWFGDANLDGEFNSSDLVQVFVTGKYEREAVLEFYHYYDPEIITNPVSWAEGDWNGDGVFDSGDMVKAFEDGGYENGPRFDAAAVPEPTSVLLLMTGLIAVGVWQRCRRW